MGEYVAGSLWCREFALWSWKTQPSGSLWLSLTPSLLSTAVGSWVGEHPLFDSGILSCATFKARSCNCETLLRSSAGSWVFLLGELSRSSLKSPDDGECSITLKEPSLPSCFKKYLFFQCEFIWVLVVLYHCIITIFLCLLEKLMHHSLVSFEGQLDLPFPFASILDVSEPF